MRPLPADVGDDAFDFLQRSFRRFDIGGAQFGGQQMTPAEYVERQVAVAIVIAVEEPSFLVPMQRVIGRIEIKDDLVRSPHVRLHQQTDQNTLDGDRLVPNPNKSALHSVGIGALLESSRSRSRKTTFADSALR